MSFSRSAMFQRSARTFCTSARSLAGTTSAVESRAIGYSEHGSPAEVLKGLRYDLPALQPGEVRLRFELSAINPADVNVVQGVYPAKPEVRTDIAPEPFSIMGNEGVAVVEGFEEDGTVEQHLKVGDRVVMGRSQLGTWQSRINLPFSKIVPLPREHPISLSQAATLSINPPTALRLLSDFVKLDPADRADHAGKKQWVIQNGANSAVGVAVIQIAKSWGVGTINLVRSRDDIDALKTHLTSLGADHVLTYEEFLSRETRQHVKEWTRDGDLRLALNCVGGKETTEMVKLLGMQGYLVTYGGMAKTQLSIPPSLFIFKQLTATGLWLSQWVSSHPSERLTMMNTLASMVSRGELKEPEVEIVDLAGGVEEMARRVREVMKRSEGGRGRKVLLRFVECE